LKISEPNFSSTIRGLSSYVAYPIPGGISETLQLKFRFTPSTTDQISLLMFMGQKGHHDYYSDHMAISFVKGYIMLTWNLGSGPRRIFTTQPIEEGARDYLVQVGRAGRRAWLNVDNLGNVTGRSPGNLVQLDVSPILYLGKIRLDQVWVFIEMFLHRWSRFEKLLNSSSRSSFTHRFLRLHI
jgi:EYS protein